MDIEVLTFLVVSTILSTCGLLTKRRRLNAGKIAMVLFCSYGLASATSALVVYAEAFIAGSSNVIADESLHKVVFLALEFLIVLGAFSFYKILKSK